MRSLFKLSKRGKHFYGLKKTIKNNGTLPKRVVAKRKLSKWLTTKTMHPATVLLDFVFYLKDRA